MAIQLCKKSSPNWAKGILGESLELEKSLHLIFWENNRAFVGPTSHNELQYKPFSLDYVEQWKQWDRERKKKKEDLLYKAIGNHHLKSKVADLTLGLGQDGLRMLYLGVDSLHSFEKMPLPYILCYDAFLRLSSAFPQFKDKWKLRHLNLTKENSDQLASFDTLYLDPMFQPENRKALPKMKIQILESLFQEKSDDFSWVPKNSRRIVKRGAKLPELWPSPSSVVAGKKVRYDVYFPEA